MDTSVEIIKVEQLPVIAERLHEIKAEIESEAQALCSLECTDETLKAVKDARADFNKVYKDLEEKRKAVKNAIMQPYNEFEEIYKECVSEPVKRALTVADGKIAEVTVKRTEEKLFKAKEYYNKVASESGLEWLEFERIGVKVNASDSDSKLCGAIDEACEKYAADVKLIMMNEYADEILYEFKKSLNAVRATVEVMERHKALEEAPRVMTDDDILDAVMADMDVKPTVADIFEKPKKEYCFKFLLDEDEYVKFMQVNKVFEYEEV